MAARIPRPPSIRGPRPLTVRGPRPPTIRGPRPLTIRGPRPPGASRGHGDSPEATIRPTKAPPGAGKGGKLDLDIEEEEVEFLYLNHKTVFTALGCQLVGTTLLLFILSTIPKLKMTLRRRVRIFRPDIFTFAVIMCLSIWMYCASKTLRIKKPWNFIIMGFFTFSVAYCMAVFCTRYINIEIFGGVILTTIFCTIAVLIVYYEMVDLLPQLEVILILVLALIVVETIHTFFWNVNVLEVFFGFIHLVLFISFLIYTIQLEQTTSPAYAYPHDEYVGASLLIYLAVVYLYFRSWLFTHAVNQLLSKPFT